MKTPRMVWMKGGLTALVYAIAALLFYGELPLIAAALAGLAGIRLWLLSRQVARYRAMPDRKNRP